DVNAPEGKLSYQLKVADGKCTLVKGSPESARVTLALSAPDFLRLVTGKLNGQTAFFQGKLKLSGDMMFAQTMQSWFKMNLNALRNAKRAAPRAARFALCGTDSLDEFEAADLEHLVHEGFVEGAAGEAFHDLL